VTVKLHLNVPEWSARPGNIPSLDGVRGVSILIVLIGHMLLPASLVGVSALGLKTFFFISGFLITRLLLAESKFTGAISLRGFYFRRILRLYPVIIVYVAIVSAVTLSRGDEIRAIDLSAVFLYFVNYLVIHYDSLGQGMSIPVGMLWSLSVEEHFYLIAPVALYLARGDAKKMLIVAVAICITSLGLRLTYAYLRPEVVNTLELYWRSETRFDCIAYGVILACLPEIKPARRFLELMATRWAFLAGTGLLLASFVLRDNYFQNTWRFTLQGIALMPIMSGLIFAAPIPYFNKVMNTRVLVWVGALSYSLYVWHGGTIFFFSYWFDMLPHPLAAPAEFGVSFILATMSYYVVERPIMRLRKRLSHAPAHNYQPSPVS